MTEVTVRKTFKYKLIPTPEQALVLGRTVRICRELYNAALQERCDAWRMCHVSVNYYQQKGQLPDIRHLRDDCAAIHSQVLQDVVLRVNRTFQAFFRRVQNGEKPGYPRFKGRTCYHSFTYPQWGNGASLHRDHNAALNIQWVGQTHRGAATRMRGVEPSIPALLGSVNYAAGNHGTCLALSLIEDSACEVLHTGGCGRADVTYGPLGS